MSRIEPGIKDDSTRDVYAIGVIGRKRQGKSTYLIKRALNYIKSGDDPKIKEKRRVLIFDPSDAEAFAHYEVVTLTEIRKGGRWLDTGQFRRWKTGIRVIKDEYEHEELFMAILTRMQNTMFIIDEAATVFPENKEPRPWMKKLILKHTNRNLDLMFVFHGFMDIHRRFRSHIWFWVIFRKIPENPTNEKWFAGRGFHPANEFWEAHQLSLTLDKTKEYVQPFVEYIQET